MAEDYKMAIKSWNAGIIRPVPVAPTGPYQNSSAPGVWTLDQVAYWEKQDLWPTAGNLDPSLFIENLFSTYLYTGNGSTQTITNGIDLSGKGGLVWIKSRSAATNNFLFDTVRGTTDELNTNTTDAEASLANSLTAFNSDGFSIGSATGIGVNAATYVSWTFRKQAKFFDVVTYTGDGVSGRTVAHNLGSVPGCIIVKKTSAAGDYWNVYHRSLGATKAIYLNATDAAATGIGFWNNTAPTSTVFSLGASGEVNANGATYVAYLFAHDAGGFGAAGTDNVITCGSYTGNATSFLDITLGYEPQLVLIKCSSAAQADGWILVDTMRGMDNSANAWLKPNTSTAESAESARIIPTATGFKVSSNAAVNTSGATYIYIAIRRGPMRTPTSGTSVFSPVTSSATGSVLTSNFPVDMGLIAGRGAVERGINDRLRGIANTDPGASPWLVTQSTAAETLNSNNPSLYNANNTSIKTGAYFGSASAVSYLFGRAPGFFDVVCYTGTGAAANVSHNLGVVPELMIVKTRSTVDFWYVYHKDVGNTKYLQLQSTAAPATSSVVWNNTTPTSSVFSVGVATNGSGVTHVAYLFSTVTGVSKVGSYTGTGTTSVKQVDCGFTGGARFVLIKRTDSTGDWYIWDSARGIVAGNDPYLLLNSTAAEVTTTDWVDTYSLGFELSTASGNNVNINNATYIFLAIA
jgi:hypothetical protein